MSKEIEIDYGNYPHAEGHEERVYKDEHGCYRYRKNSVVAWLLEFGNVDLNKIWITYSTGAFSMEDMMEFYRLIGYSLDGFEDIWHHRDPATRHEEDEEDG